MKVYTVTFIASSLSGIALLISLLAVVSIYNDIRCNWSQLDQEMDHFRMVTNDLWSDMMKLSKETTRLRRQGDYNEEGGTKAGGLKSGEESGARQEVPSRSELAGEASAAAAGECVGEHCSKQAITGCVGATCTGGGTGSKSELGGAAAPAAPFGAQPPGGPTPESGCFCNPGNKCPSGPPGPKGSPGFPGPNGQSGVSGKEGKDAVDITVEHLSVTGCFHCPPGPTGPPGSIGRPGAHGMPGTNGTPGNRGRDSQPGTPGEMGPPGPQGKEGPSGLPGEKGLDGRKPIGRAGPKGTKGPQGAHGLPGNAGKDSSDGPEGPPGPAGPPGKPGPQGPEGEAGFEGRHGKTGRDAEYCPCPGRAGEGGREIGGGRGRGGGSARGGTRSKGGSGKVQVEEAESYNKRKRIRA